jgi:SAM-dependent methyltransferase
MRACLLCNETDPARFRIWFDSYLKLFRCRSCGFVFQVDAVGSDTTVQDYSEYYDLAFAEKGQKFMYPARATVLQDICRRADNHTTTGRELLDIGCGDGQFLYWAAQQGFAAHGIEPSKSLSAYAASVSGADIATAPYTDDAFPAERFDAITMIQVLEHMASPVDVLKTAYRHLKPGGVILVEVPSIAAPHFLAYRGTGIEWFVARAEGVIPSHISYFSPQSMERMTAKAGFCMDKIITGRWRYKYRWASGPIGKVIDPVFNALRIGGILYIGRKPAGSPQKGS